MTSRDILYSLKDQLYTSKDASNANYQRTEILRPTIVRGQGRDTPEALEIMRFLAENWTKARVKHSDEENFFDLKTRALRALDYLVERPERTLLVVTHGTFVCMLLCCMMAGEGVSPELFDHIHQLVLIR